VPTSTGMTPTATTQSTRAVGLVDFGEPETLGVVERPVPELGPEDVRIRVKAAAVNPADVVFRTGARAQALAKFEPPYVPGMDAAGTVEAIGDAVAHLVPGDRVMATVNPFRAAGGAQTELLVVPASWAVRIPENLGTEAAATLPMSGLTAVEALDLLALPRGGTLAITGGTGWVATLAIPLAKSRGLQVIADAPAAEADAVRALGADHIVERGDGVAERIRAIVPEGVDGVLDTAMIGPPILAAIRDGGGWVVVRGQQDETVRGIVRYNVGVLGRFGDTAALEDLAQRAAAGELPTTVAQSFRPEEASEAHRRQAAGGVRGRLVIVF
jgi:NADPH:quinone reductase